MTAEYQRCFEVLGLAPEANAGEIKRAYFRLVRAHPPEKEPEKFQEIRQAYEMLKEGPPPAEEERFSPPHDPGVLYLLEQARRRVERSEHRAAADCVEHALKLAPDDPFLLLVLARLQIRAGNPRKAAGTAKKLQKCASDFSEAYALAANGYYGSGWYKKAYPEYKKAYELGYRDFDFLSDFADAADDNGEHEPAAALRQELLNNTKWDRSNIDDALYLYEARMEHLAEGAALLPLLEEYGQFLKANRRILRDRGLALASPFMNRLVEKPGLLRLRSLYAKTDALLEQIGDMADGVDREDLLAARSQTLQMALGADPAFSENWEMLASAVMPPQPDDARLCRYATLDLLLCLMKEREQSLQMIPVIRRDYPFFYAYAKEYCDMLASDAFEGYFEKLKKEHARLSEEYTGGFFYKRYPEEKTLPRGVLAYSDTKPFVRETKKPGRNDPCPCGSGLKFKRCCLGKGIYD